MKTLVVGASGATGKHAVNLLLENKKDVKVIVRSVHSVPEHWKNNSHIEIIEANVLDFSIDEMTKILNDCTAAISCLGHNLTFKGMYGKPRKLVRDSVELICRAVQKNDVKSPFKFVLMNTTGNKNPDQNEKISIAQSLVIGLLRLLLPPHVDNEQAAEFLRSGIGQKNSRIEWVVVRPDTLLSLDSVSEYTLHPSPIRSAIFDSGKTSRINVGHFMRELITNTALWNTWKGKMPVIYNVED